MPDTAADWHRLCTANDLSVEGTRIRVAFDNGRSHRVRVHETDDGYLLTATIVGWNVVQGLDEPYGMVWSRNRHSRLVGYRIDGSGALVAHGWTPRAGLTAKAFQALVRTIAREADRYELQLTGRDRR
ncbi:hypothetical protein [Dactylosporangium salmoneum]|uniref:YbjN domain-containing protein n=1 Tax=Dactylosporangium salmoneum TaxID=53361 RepID=A0ABN3FJX8_9ACTN